MRSGYGWFAVGVFGALLSSCQSKSPEDSITSSPESMAVDALIDSLHTLDGHYAANAVSGVLEFQGPDSLFARIASYGHVAVDRLTECMDSGSSTRVELDGRNVPLGVLCADVLDRTVMHEAADSLGDADATWPGYFDPYATDDQRRAAKAAWSELLHGRQYVLRRDL